MKTVRAMKVFVVILVLALAGTMIGAALYLRDEYDRTTYFGKTSINGYSAENMTPAQMLEQLIAKYMLPTIEIREGGKDSIIGKLEDYGYTIDEERLLSDLEKALSAQKSNILVMIESLMNGNAFQVKIPFIFNREVFNRKVCASSLKEARFPSIDAKMEYDEKKNEYYIIPETYGNEFDDTKLQDYVKERTDELISEETPDLHMAVNFPDEIYIKPVVTHDDLTLNSTCNIYNQFVKAKITYLFGTQKQVLDWSTIKDWLRIENGVGVLDDELVYEYVEQLAYRYNTRYYERTFRTSIGTTVTIPGDFNTYGYTVNEDAEYSQLLLDIRSNSEIEREPIYYSVTVDGYETPVYYARDGRDDLAGTYVEVNLSMQHLWFYKDYGLIVESDFVSGSVAKNAETNTGVFPLAYKESPSVLVGEDAADGYRTEVQYWMPFSDGQGLHDAKWRGSFGGNIYMTNGSHGCVNLPVDVASVIYYNIEPGMAIIVYK